MIMGNLLKLAKHHWLAISLALVCGLIYMGPHLAIMAELGKDYHGINFLVGDEQAYAAQANEVKEGYWLHANPYLFEYKNAPATVLQWSEVILGFFARIVRADIPTLFIVLRFFCSFAFFLLLYALAFKIFRSRAMALLAASLGLFGIDWMAAYRQPLEIIKTMFWQNDLASHFTGYDGLLDPLFIFPFFILGLFTAWKAYIDRRLRWSLINGLVLALNVYLYFYFWTFLAVINGLLVLVFIRQRRWKDLRNFSFGLCLAAILAAPFIFWQLIPLLSPVKNLAIIEEVGNHLAIDTHRLRIDKGVWIITFLFAAYLAYKKYQLRSKKAFGETELFVTLMLASAIITSNQQVITGKEIQQHHYYWFTSMQALFMGLSYLIWDIGKRLKWPLLFKRYLVAVAIIIIFIFGIGTQACAYKAFLPEFRYAQRYGLAFDWLKQNTQPDSVVLSNDKISEMIPIYTQDNVYYAPHCATYLTTPFERREWSYMVYHYLQFRSSTSSLEESFQQDRANIGVKLFEGVYYRDLCGSATCFPDEKLNNLIQDYKAFLSKPFGSQLQKYRVDYVIWDTQADPGWKMDDFNFLEKITEMQGLNIYRIKYVSEKSS